MSVPVNMSVHFYTGSIFQENYPPPFSSLNTQQPTFLREITLLPVDSGKARVELRWQGVRNAIYLVGGIKEKQGWQCKTKKEGFQQQVIVGSKRQEKGCLQQGMIVWRLKGWYWDIITIGASGLQHGVCGSDAQNKARQSWMWYWHPQS